MRDRPLPSLVILIAAETILSGSAAWALVSGFRLGASRSEAQGEEGRLMRTHTLLADAPFRTQLAAALEAKRLDAIPFRTKLKGLADRLGISVEGLSQTETQLPLLSRKEITVSLVLKDVSMARFLDYARTVELEVPDAVVSQAALKPVALAGDRWEVQLKVSRRVKPDA